MPGTDGAIRPSRARWRPSNLTGIHIIFSEAPHLAWPRRPRSSWVQSSGAVNRPREIMLAVDGHSCLTGLWPDLIEAHHWRRTAEAPSPLVRLVRPCPRDRCNPGGPSKPAEHDLTRRITRRDGPTRRACRGATARVAGGE